MNNSNIFGGTPKKTIDLLTHFKNDGSIYFYSKNDDFKEHLIHFESTGANILKGNFGWNFYKHLKVLISHIDKNNIKIVHAQFNMGEVLSILIKLIRPNIKIVISFVLPFSDKKKYKRIISKFVYHFVDGVIFVSNYVRSEKTKQFPILKSKKNKVIYNGVSKRDVHKKVKHNNTINLLDVAGLVNWKNLDVVIKAVKILKKKYQITNVRLNIAGDGPERKRLQKLINDNELSNNITILGYTKNIGDLLYESDIFVHPAYAEAFGIAVPEAMLAKKPIIVSNSGALPELIDNNINGLVVDPHSPNDWAKAIYFLIKNKKIASEFTALAFHKASKEFCVTKFINNYKMFYKSIYN